MGRLLIPCALGLPCTLTAGCSSSDPPAATALPTGPPLRQNRPNLLEFCGSASGIELAGCVDHDRYLNDLRFIAAPRPSGSDHWQRVQDLCAERFAELGFEVERHDYGGGVNVVGTLPGASTEAAVVVSAHYDHIFGCLGADDNASGVAGLFELARVLASAQLDGTLVVACWDEEERGLVGSRAYAQRAARRSEPISVAFVFDMIGYWNAAPDSQLVGAPYQQLFADQVARVLDNQRRADFIAVIADAAVGSAAESFQQHGTTAGVPVIVFELPATRQQSASAAQLWRSDHASFWEAGFPALLVFDTAELRNPHYHCRGGADTVSDVDVAFAGQVVQATVAAVAERLGVVAAD